MLYTNPQKNILRGWIFLDGSMHEEHEYKSSRYNFVPFFITELFVIFIIYVEPVSSIAL